MGFESFRVDLSGGDHEFENIRQNLGNLAHVEADKAMTGPHYSSCYIWSDGSHVIEIEVVKKPIRISCRFTLCHPTSIDSAFVKFTRLLMTKFDMNVTIGDDVEPSDSGPFGLQQFGELSSALVSYIAARRTEWIDQFGHEQLAATTDEAFEIYILPLCRDFAATHPVKPKRKKRKGS